MAKSLGTLVARLLLDTKGWLAGSAQAGASTKTFAGGLASKLLPTMGGLGQQIGATVAGAVGFSAAMHSMASGMEQVDRQAKLADRLGITVGEVQKLSLAADLAGTDVELLARSMLKMGKNIGSGGVSLDKRLFQVADALAQIKDAGQRGAAAEKIFGKGGQELINTLIQGGRGIRNSADAIDRFGIALTRVDAAKVEAANDAWTEMTTVVSGLRNLMLVEFAPEVTNFLQDWLRGLGLIKQMYDNIKFTQAVAAADKNTKLDYVAALYQRAIATGEGLAKGKFEGTFAETLEGLREQRKDAARNAALSGSVGGAALLGKNLLGGGAGDVSGGRVGFASGAAERGTVEAGKLIQNAGGSPFHTALKGTNDRLDKVIRNTDPRRTPQEPRMRRAAL